jgi:cytochrome P450
MHQVSANAAMQKEMDRQIEIIRSGKLDQDAKVGDFATVFEELLNSKLPASELSHQRLQNEAQSVIGAGFETTRWALTVLTYHILANPQVHKRVKEELATAIPDTDKIPPWEKLQNLEYLSACVEEGGTNLFTFLLLSFRRATSSQQQLALRVGYGIVQRSPRVSHTHSFKYENWVIPVGAPVSLDSFHMHHHEEIFPDSYAYKPERWLGDPKGPDGIKQLSRYMVAFSRGGRICLGMTMAYAEIYTAAATLLRRFDLSLYETDQSNVEFYQDFITPQPRPGSLGVRVLVN